MKNKESSSFKDFYHNKNGKAILFFGFYLIFFIVLASVLRNNQNNRQKENINDNSNQVVESITTIRSLYDNDFTYNFEINDNGEITRFNGSKNNIDYPDFTHKYFLNYININQLIKKSKVTEAGQTFTRYEIENETLNDILNTDVLDGMNKITEIYGSIVNQNEGKYCVILDLSAFMEKEIYQITLNYKVGEV